MALSTQIQCALGRLFIQEDRKGIWSWTKQPCGSWGLAGIVLLTCCCSRLVPEEPAVLSSVFRSLLLPSQPQAQPCWVLCILEGCARLWHRPGKSQTSSSRNPTAPSRSKLVLAAAEFLLPLPVTGGSRRMLVLRLALGWILADRQAHPNLPWMGTGVFFPSDSVCRRVMDLRRVFPGCSQCLGVSLQPPSFPLWGAEGTPW